MAIDDEPSVVVMKISLMAPRAFAISTATESELTR